MKKRRGMTSQQIMDLNDGKVTLKQVEEENTKYNSPNKK